MIHITHKRVPFIGYPGGKVRARKTICQYIPSNIKTLVSPFVGGGAVELAVAQEGIKVLGYDVFEPLVNLWQCMIQDCDKVVDSALQYYPVTRESFKILKSGLISETEYDLNYEAAGILVLLHRYSFGQLGLSGGYVKRHRNTLAEIENMRKFNNSNLQVQHMDFKESIQNNKNHFMYLDPPYAVNNTYYGIKGSTHKGFDHQTLADLLHTTDRWILSYNNCDYIDNLYEGYTKTYPKWQYSIGKDLRKDNSNEVLILSHEIAEYNKENKLLQ